MDSRNGSVSETPLDAEIGSFFDSAPPLKDCDGIAKKLKDFIEFNSPPPGKNLTHLLVFNQVLAVLISK
jgi:phosphopantothenate-cysteine ligase